MMMHRTVLNGISMTGLGSGRASAASMSLGVPSFTGGVIAERASATDFRLDGDTIARKRPKRRSPARPVAPSASVPQSAASIGQGERFRYWQGASGRRYLFSRVEAGELATFADAVVILAEGSGLARFEIGEINRAGQVRDRVGAPILLDADVAYVHLLARDAEARAAVMDDIAAAR